MRVFVFLRCTFNVIEAVVCVVLGIVAVAGLRDYGENTNVAQAVRLFFLVSRIPGNPWCLSGILRSLVALLLLFQVLKVSLSLSSSVVRRQTDRQTDTETQRRRCRQGETEYHSGPLVAHSMSGGS